MDTSYCIKFSSRLVSPLILIFGIHKPSSSYIFKFKRISVDCIQFYQLWKNAGDTQHHKKTTSQNKNDVFILKQSQNNKKKYGNSSILITFALNKLEHSEVHIMQVNKRFPSL